MAERPAELYDLFWENSKLGPATLPGFRRRMEEWAATDRVRHPLRYPSPEVPLSFPKDRLATLMARRRSRREFSDRPLGFRKIGRLCAAFCTFRDGSRSFGSAGGTYPVEVFCLLEHVKGGPGRVVAHYNSERHSLSVVGALPPWEEYAAAINLDGLTGTPHVIFVFVVDADRSTEKYGERGGRFALIEVGHAAQNLALRLSAERLVGCEVGGLLDERITTLLGLGGTGRQVALGYACGRRRGPRIKVPGTP